MNVASFQRNKGYLCSSRVSVKHKVFTNSVSAGATSSCSGNPYPTVRQCDIAGNRGTNFGVDIQRRKVSIVVVLSNQINRITADIGTYAITET